MVSVAARTSPRRMSARPLTTSWVRPDSRRSVSRAASSVGGLPQISSSVATTVSQPSDELVGGGIAGLRARERLAQRVLGGDDARRPLVLLGDVGDADLEVEAEAAEDGAALWRAAGQDEAGHRSCAPA